ncbi:MAG: MoxR family ATPase [Chloroflexi bacterium]|nr:MoxR family ATPase [Chloroflexota bacterium]
MRQPQDVARAADALVAHLGRDLFGLDRVIRLLLAALLVDGHVLLEEVPGTGKTTLAKALALALGLDFARLQFTPDLLPSDVTGLYWFDQRAGAFQFRPGPIFAQVVLADEVNRATPRTQSALLEAMAERQVTIEGQTHILPEPFLVLATQNPVEMEGTFPLPEAQVDRFLMRLRLGYPAAEAEHAILRRHASGPAQEALAALAELRDLAGLKATVRSVHVSDAVRGYIVELVRASRRDDQVELGVSPRGALHLHRAAQALAAIEGRDFVSPDAVKAAAMPVLAHRIRVEAGASLRGRSAEQVVERLLEVVPVPVE